jgi:hypothetical protein
VSGHEKLHGPCPPPETWGHAVPIGSFTVNDSAFGEQQVMMGRTNRGGAPGGWQWDAGGRPGRGGWERVVVGEVQTDTSREAAAGVCVLWRACDVIVREQ